MTQISLKRAILFALTAPFRQAGEILPRVFLPWLLGGFLLYGALHLYLLRLQIFLNQPGDRTGSPVLGVAMGGLLLLLFLHSMISASVAGVLLGRPETPIAHIRARRREWRLYAANLRFLLLPAFALVFFSICRKFILSMALIWVLRLAILIVIVGGLARFGFLLAPVSVSHYDGPILRRSWRMSSGHILSILFLTFFLLLPGLAIERLAEFVLRVCGLSPSWAGVHSFATLIALYGRVLPAMLCIIALVYLLNVLLLTACGVEIYRQLAEGKNS